MKQLKKIDDFMGFELSDDSKQRTLAGIAAAGDTIRGCVEYSEVNAATGDMRQYIEKDDGTFVSDNTVYYPKWPL